MMNEQTQNSPKERLTNQVNETIQANNTNLNVDAHSYIPTQTYTSSTQQAIQSESRSPQHLTHSHPQRPKLTPLKTVARTQDIHTPATHREIQESIEIEEQIIKNKLVQDAQQLLSLSEKNLPQMLLSILKSPSQKTQSEPSVTSQQSPQYTTFSQELAPVSPTNSYNYRTQHNTLTQDYNTRYDMSKWKV